MRELTIEPPNCVHGHCKRHGRAPHVMTHFQTTSDILLQIPSYAPARPTYGGHVHADLMAGDLELLPTWR